jgi:DNA replication protein DnaD
MASVEDISVWEHRLQQELDGLKYCQQKVAVDASIPQAIKTRFRDIVATLNDNIYQVLGRCRQLRTETASSTAFEKRAERLQEEYKNVLRNIEKLLKTVDVQAEPKRKHSTLRSPARTGKSTAKVTRSKSATGIVALSDGEITLKEVTSELKELKDALRHVKHRVEKHAHERYEAELKETKEENDRLWGKLHTMQEEQTRLFQLITTLTARIDALQSTHAEQAQETRLLPKRTGEAAELMRQ